MGSEASTPTDVLRVVWGAYQAVGSRIYGIGARAVIRREPTWFALLSGEDEAELNVCGLLPGADAGSAASLVGAIDECDVPAIVFVSEHADPAAAACLASEGFETADTEEPLMWSEVPPERVPTAFEVRRADGDSDLAAAITLTAEAHLVGRDLLERTFLRAARDRAVSVWLAFDGDEPVSVAWLGREGPALGVKEMMTPARHQRRGAARAVLTTALAEEWTATTGFTYLLATPAGRRLYESLGYRVVDRVKTRHRGLSPEVLSAIGQLG